MIKTTECQSSIISYSEIFKHCNFVLVIVTMIDGDSNNDDDDDDDEAIDKLVDVCDKVVKMALTTSVNMKNIAVCEQSDSSSDSDLETTQETKLKVRCYVAIKISGGSVTKEQILCHET